MIDKILKVIGLLIALACGGAMLFSFSYVVIRIIANAWRGLLAIGIILAAGIWWYANSDKTYGGITDGIKIHLIIIGAIAAATLVMCL